MLEIIKERSISTQEVGQDPCDPANRVPSRISGEKPDTRQTGCHCEERSDAAIPDISEQNVRDRHEPLRGSRDDTIFERTFENWNRSCQIRIE
jgi:hypothetical protein